MATTSPPDTEPVPTEPDADDRPAKLTYAQRASAAAEAERLVAAAIDAQK